MTGPTPAIRAALERLLQHIDDPTRTPFTRDYAIAAARAALAAEPVGEGLILQWRENMPPSEDCRYDHCIAETPFGRFLISWKGWKQFDSPIAEERPWGDWYGTFNSVDAAKAACQEKMDKRLHEINRSPAPAAPEVGEVAELADRLGWIATQLGDIGWSDDSASVARAATLLQQAAPAPAVVPVVYDAGDGIMIHRTRQDPEAWAVRRDLECLALNGAWDYEPAPSDRTQEWLARHRFASVEAAAHAIPLPQVGEGES